MARPSLWYRASLPLLVAGLGLFACEGHSVGDVDPASYEREGWNIVSVEEFSEGCVKVGYEKPAAWQCSPEQIEIAKGQGSNTADAGDGAGPISFSTFEETPPEAVELLDLPCDDLVELRREQSLGYQRGQLDASYRATLQSCLKPTDVAFFSSGDSSSYCGVYSDDGSDASSDDSGSYYTLDGGDGSPSAGAEHYSTTNNQVAGVEEADYVKNDSGHIYLLTPTALEVFDSWPVVDAKRIKRIEFSAEPRRLLLSGERLVVFLRKSAPAGTAPSEQGCTYGYNCDVQSEGGGTEVRVFDVSSPDSPQLLQTYQFSGGYLASRRIGDAVFLVAADQLEQVAPQSLLQLEFPKDVTAGTVDAAHAKLTKRLEDEVPALSAESFLPAFATDLPTSCEGFLRAPGSNGASLLSLYSFDLSVLGSPTRTTIATAPGFVYASSEALYVATRFGGDGYYYYGDAASDVSAIHKFSLTGSTPSYQGSAVLRGHVLNQFALDELSGVLRVASTSGAVPSADVSSSLSTFHDVDGRFTRYGELTGLAPSEDIRSVRFDGTRGFVVTFKKTDPLFVLDMANPAAPVVEGELKIPGFSTYMQPLDHNHLLAVGFDADDQGSFAYFNGIQVQIFDVTQLDNPLLLHKLAIGTRGTSSEALMNHLAFNYFPAEKVLALPITICEGGGDGTFGDKMTFNGVLALDIDVVDGIAERGRLPFADPASSDALDYGEVGCFGWWSESTSNVKRTIFFEDYLYGLSDATLRAAQLDTLSDVLVSIPVGK